MPKNNHKLKQDAKSAGMSTRELAKNRLLNEPLQPLPSVISPTAETSTVIHESFPERGVTNIYIDHATLQLPENARIVANNVGSLK